MEGLILMAVYVVVAFIFEAGAVGVGVFADSVWPAMSLFVFMAISAAGLGAAWPIALWLTRSWDSA